MTVAAAPVTSDAYLAEVASRLRGPRRLRADLLLEIRDGLTDATDAWTRAGLPDTEAQHRATAEFGDPGRLADEFQTVLATTTLRRLAPFAGGLPLLTLAWSKAWSSGRTESGGGQGLCHVLSIALDWASVALAVGAALGWLLLGRSSSSHQRATSWARRIGAVLVAGVALFLVAAVLLTAGNLTLVATTMGHGLSLVVVACTALVLAGLGRAAVRAGRALPRKLAG